MESDLDKTKRLALEIKEKIETCTPEQREEYLDEIYKKWIVPYDPHNSVHDYFKLAIRNFDISTDNLQIGLFERSQKIVIYQLVYLRIFMITDDLDDDKASEYDNKFNKLFRAVIDAGNAITCNLFLLSSMTQEDIGYNKIDLKYEISRFTEPDFTTINEYQVLIIYLLEQIQRREYRRYVIDDKGLCYKKVYNEKINSTYFHNIIIHCHCHES